MNNDLFTQLVNQYSSNKSVEGHLDDIQSTHKYKSDMEQAAALDKAAVDSGTVDKLAKGTEYGTWSDGSKKVTADVLRGFGTVRDFIVGASIQTAGLLSDDIAEMIAFEESQRAEALISGKKFEGFFDSEEGKGWLTSWAEGLEESISAVAATDYQNSAFKGDLFDPSTWGVEDGATGAGIATNILGSIGYMAPQFAGTLGRGVIGGLKIVAGTKLGASLGTSVAADAARKVAVMGSKEIMSNTAGRILTGTAVGSIQAAMDGLESTRELFEGLTNEELYIRSSLFRERINEAEKNKKGKLNAEEIANIRIGVEQRAINASMGTHAVVGGVGSGIFHSLLGKPSLALASKIPVVNKIGLSNAALAGSIEAAVEGVQEAAESVASNVAVNLATADSTEGYGNLIENVSEGTFNDFVMGASAGGIIGTGAAIRTGNNIATEVKTRDVINKTIQRSFESGNTDSLNAFFDDIDASIESGTPLSEVNINNVSYTGIVNTIISEAARMPASPQKDAVLMAVQARAAELKIKADTLLQNATNFSHEGNLNSFNTQRKQMADLEAKGLQNLTDEERAEYATLTQEVANDENALTSSEVDQLAILTGKASRARTEAESAKISSTRARIQELETRINNTSDEKVRAKLIKQAEQLTDNFRKDVETTNATKLTDSEAETYKRLSEKKQKATALRSSASNKAKLESGRADVISAALEESTTASKSQKKASRDYTAAKVAHTEAVKSKDEAKIKKAEEQLSKATSNLLSADNVNTAESQISQNSELSEKYSKFNVDLADSTSASDTVSGSNSRQKRLNELRTKALSTLSEGEVNSWVESDRDSKASLSLMSLTDRQIAKHKKSAEVASKILNRVNSSIRKINKNKATPSRVQVAGELFTPNNFEEKLNKIASENNGVIDPETINSVSNMLIAHDIENGTDTSKTLLESFEKYLPAATLSLLNNANANLLPKLDELGSMYDARRDMVEGRSGTNTIEHWMGYTAYKANLATAIANNNLALFNTLLTKLDRLNQNRMSKSQAVNEVWERVTSGEITQGYVVPVNPSAIGSTLYEAREEPSNVEFELTIGEYSSNLVGAINTEATFFAEFAAAMDSFAEEYLTPERMAEYRNEVTRRRTSSKEDRAKKPEKNQTKATKNESGSALNKTKDEIISFLEGVDSEAAANFAETYKDVAEAPTADIGQLTKNTSNANTLTKRLQTNPTSYATAAETTLANLQTQIDALEFQIHGVSADTDGSMGLTKEAAEKLLKDAKEAHSALSKALGNTTTESTNESTQPKTAQEKFEETESRTEQRATQSTNRTAKTASSTQSKSSTNNAEVIRIKEDSAKIKTLFKKATDIWAEFDDGVRVASREEENEVRASIVEPLSALLNYMSNSNLYLNNTLGFRENLHTQLADLIGATSRVPEDSYLDDVGLLDVGGLTELADSISMSANTDEFSVFLSSIDKVLQDVIDVENATPDLFGSDTEQTDNQTQSSAKAEEKTTQAEQPKVPTNPLVDLGLSQNSLNMVSDPAVDTSEATVDALNETGEDILREQNSVNPNDTDALRIPSKLSRYGNAAYNLLTAYFKRNKNFEGVLGRSGDSLYRGDVLLANLEGVSEGQNAANAAIWNAFTAFANSNSSFFHINGNSPISLANIVSDKQMLGSNGKVYSSNSLVYYLMHPETGMDPLALEAMKYSLFANLPEIINGAGIASNTDIRMALGVADEGVFIDPSLREALMGTKGTRDQIIESLGKSAVAALGLTTKGNDVPVDARTSLIHSLGSVLYGHLRANDVIDEKVVYERDLELLRVETRGKDKVFVDNAGNVVHESEVTFRRLVELNESQATERLSKFFDRIDGALKASPHFMSILFEGEYERTQPVLERDLQGKDPKSLFKDTTTRSGATLSSKQIEIEKTKTAVPFGLDKSMYALMSTFSEDQLLSIHGAGDINAVTTLSSVHSNEAMINGKARDIRLALEFANAEGVQEGDNIYFPTYVWSQNRTSYASRVQGQNNKVARHLFKAKAWEVKVDITEENDVYTGYIYLLAQGLGINLDRLPNEYIELEYLEKMAKLNDSRAEGLSENSPNVLDDIIGLVEGTFTPSEDNYAKRVQHIVDTVTGLGEGFASLDALYNAAVLEASRGKEAYVTTSYVGEVDGKTNGAAMAFLQMGVVASSKTGKDIAAAMGLFSDGTQDYGDYAANNGGHDAYQLTAIAFKSAWNEHVPGLMNYDSFNTDVLPFVSFINASLGKPVTKPNPTEDDLLLDDTDSSKADRNMAKGIMLPITFASSAVTAANKGVGNHVINYIASEFESIVNSYPEIAKVIKQQRERGKLNPNAFKSINPTELKELQTRLNAAIENLNKSLVGIDKYIRHMEMERQAMSTDPTPRFIPKLYELAPIETTEDLVNFDLDIEIQQYLRFAIGETASTAMREAITDEFGNLMEGRNALTKFATNIGIVFNTWYKSALEAYTEQLIATGDMPYVQHKGKRVPARSLTKRELEIFESKLESVWPKLPHYLGRGTQNSEMDLIKFRRGTDKGDTEQRATSSLVELHTPEGTTTKLRSSYNLSQIEELGVGMFANGAHSLDSAMMGALVEKIGDILNIHDAALMSLNALMEGSHELNKAFYELNAEYSLPYEIVNSFLDILINMKQVSEDLNKQFPTHNLDIIASLSEGLISNPRIRDIFSISAERTAAVNNPIEYLREITRVAINTAKMAERTKLNKLLEIQHVAQYSMPGHNWQVSEESRAKVQAELDKLESKYDDLWTDAQAFFYELEGIPSTQFSGVDLTKYFRDLAKSDPHLQRLAAKAGIRLDKIFQNKAEAITIDGFIREFTKWADIRAVGKGVDNTANLREFRAYLLNVMELGTGLRQSTNSKSIAEILLDESINSESRNLIKEVHKLGGMDPNAIIRNFGNVSPDLLANTIELMNVSSHTPLVRKLRAIQSVLDNHSRANAPEGQIGTNALNLDPNQEAFHQAATPVKISDYITSLTFKGNKPKGMGRYYFDILEAFSNSLPTDSIIAFAKPGVPFTVMVNGVAEEVTLAEGTHGQEYNFGGKSLVLINSETQQTSFNDYIKSNGQLQEPIVHELLHAATSYVINVWSDPVAKEQLLSKETIHAVDLLNTIFESFQNSEILEKLTKITNSKGKTTTLNIPEVLMDGAPALANLREFVVYAMSNPELMEFLGSISIDSFRQATGFDETFFTRFERFSNAELGDNSILGRTVTLLDTLAKSVSKMLKRFFGIKGVPIKNTLLTRVIANSLAMTESNLAHARKNPDNLTNINSTSNMVQNLKDATSSDILDSLGSTFGRVTTEHEQHLMSLLTEVVEPIQGALGINELTVLFNSDEQNLIQDIAGILPVTRTVLNSQFNLTAQELYVAEQLYATIKDNIENSPALERQLYVLYNDASKVLTPADFYNGDFDANKDTDISGIDAAIRKHSFIMGASAAHNTDRLAAISAVILASEELQKVLSTKQKAIPAKQEKTISDFFRGLYAHMTDFSAKTLSKVDRKKSLFERHKDLAFELVRVESNHRRNLAKSKSSLEKAIDKVTGFEFTPLHTAINNALNSEFVNSPNRGNIINILAKGGRNIINRSIEESLGVLQQGITGFVSPFEHKGGKLLHDLMEELVGETEETAYAYSLFRTVGVMEKVRLDIKSNIAGVLQNSWGDLYFKMTDEEKNIVTKGVLRADLQSLLETYGIDKVTRAITDKTYRKGLIAYHLNQLDQITGNHKAQVNLYKYQAKALANYMVHNAVTSPITLLNAEAIAKNVGMEGTIEYNPEYAVPAEAVIDKLASLYALESLGMEDQSTLTRLIEADATDNGSKGLNQLLRAHRRTQEDSKANLFTDYVLGQPVVNTLHMQKGYISDIYDNNISVTVAANQAEVNELLKKGYKIIRRLPKDAEDLSVDTDTLMAINDGGKMDRKTGIFSTTSEGTIGQATTFKPNATINKVNALWDAIKTGVVPLNSSANNDIALPLINSEGEITAYRYTPGLDLLENVLNREVDFTQIMGKTSSIVYDKAHSKVYNYEAVNELYDDYQAYLALPDPVKKLTVFDKITPEDEEWRLLPETTKDHIVQTFGEEALYIRRNLRNVFLGYRKKAISNLVRDEKKNLLDSESVSDAIGEAVSQLLYLALGNKAKVRVRRAEDFYKALVSTVKDIRIVRNLRKIYMDFTSNLSILYVHGMGFKDMIGKTREGFELLLEYEQIRHERSKLAYEMRIDPSLTNAANIGRLAVYDERLRKSKLRPLIEAGLYQSIVTDVENEARVNQDLQRIYDAFGNSSIPEGAKDVVRFMGMTPSTELYKAMHMLASSTDIVARYALYSHMMAGAESLEPELREQREANVIRLVRDSYVDYNLPSNPMVQFLDDYGTIPFIKYYMRMNRVYLGLLRDKPGRLLQLQLASSLIDSLDTVNSSTIISKIANNAVIGPTDMLGSWESLTTMQLATSLIP